eukprot:1148011-Pelagomonas_calceolata.AAC.1
MQVLQMHLSKQGLTTIQTSHPELTWRELPSHVLVGWLALLETNTSQLLSLPSPQAGSTVPSSSGSMRSLQTQQNRENRHSKGGLGSHIFVTEGCNKAAAYKETAAGHLRPERCTGWSKKTAGRKQRDKEQEKSKLTALATFP